MKLFEILGTIVPVKWSHTNNQHRGTFTIDGKADAYTIQIDEYDVAGKTLADFGFVTNGDITAKESNVSSAKIIGAVLNGAFPKIKEIDPDVILIAVNKASGLVDSRKSLYTALVSWMKKRSSYLFESDWVENDSGFFKLISKSKLTDDELNLFISQVKK